MDLRYYQTDAIAAIWKYFETSKGNPVVSMPTGTGKSHVIGKFIQKAFTAWPGQRIIQVTHVKELISQNYQKFLQIWPTAPAGIYSAGLNRRELRPITFCGIGSVAKKAQMFGHVDLALMDECHLMSHKEDTSYDNFFSELKKINPAFKVIGFTATPYRLGQGRLIDPIKANDGGHRLPLFTDICYDITGMTAFNRLIDEGFLCKLIPRATSKEIDTSNVHIIGGEFDAKEIQEASDKDEITQRACEEMLHFGADRNHWLVFATGITHAEHVASALRHCGVSAEAIHSQLENTNDRDRLLADFKSGKIRCLVNNNVLTTGFDFPAIDLIGMLRPTTSPGLWVQMLGRGTRPFPGKQNCLVLDFAGNTKRLGPINDVIVPRKRSRNGGGEAPVKLCEACGVYNHASLRICCNCGNEFPVAVKITSEASQAELIREDKPVLEIFEVTEVVYAKHEPQSKPPSLKVTYSCGKYQKFSEYICLEHPGGLAQHKARDWWRERTGEDDGVPETIDEAQDRISELATPTHIKVWVNKKYPQIMLYDFSGQGFIKKLDRPGVFA